MFHTVELVPIEANQGCREIIERERGWFQAQQPEFPAGCVATAGP